MVTEYVLQYQPEGDANVWLDGGGPWTAIDEEEALKRLAWVRSAPQQNLFRKEWRLVERITIERVIVK